MDELTRLFVAARDGDGAAMGEFLERCQADVWRFCAAFLGPHDADDATQEAFVRAWRSAPTFRAESSARTWLLTIARRTCWEQDRRRRRLPVPATDELELLAADPTERVEIDDLIAHLHPDRRSALILTQVLGLSYEEAAQVSDCPIGTIRSRVARARADLLRAAGDGQPGRQPRRTASARPALGE